MSRVCLCCGREVEARSRFCPRCGASLEARLHTGDLLKGDEYRITRTLTKGGMGAVYLAEDRRAFDRLCVVKQMLEYYDPTDGDERLRAQQRFEEEGRTLASLSHPGVPKIYAFFTEKARYYIVMEYIQGENLETFVTHLDDAGHNIPAKRLPREELIRYAVQMCHILEYLHTQPHPVVHQDIKPANFILERHLDYVRLVDFGTAKTEMPRDAQPGKGAKASIYGTDGYAAPEQYRGKPEPRSDVFALAATMYHILTDDDPSQHPFKWPQVSSLPKELAVALERALRPVPDQRSSAHELCESLEAIATPRRALESFTFPGGAQIRSVGALPTLCDEHWDAARSFLYNGDFQRWLRDINRHDLALSADEIAKAQENHDAGLEAFLHVVDPGLPNPKIVVDPANVDLGSIARESALIRRVTALNLTRGYVLAKVTSSQPWLEIYPPALHLWAGKPTDIRVNVRAEGLPFRSQQRGAVGVLSDNQPLIEVPVMAHVSLIREVWRIIRRALSAAIPESGRMFVAGWRLFARVTGAIGAPFTFSPWLALLLWLLLSVGVGLGLYYLPAWAEGLQVAGWTAQRVVAWPDYLLPSYYWPIVLGPPLLLAALWLAFLLIALSGGLVLGALRGAWKSFFR